MSEEKKLPEGWEWKKLGEVCHIELGKTPARSNPKYWDIDKKQETYGYQLQTFHK